MTKRACVYAILVSSLLFGHTTARARMGGLLWPIDERQVFTSSFGEFRPYRFHAGIDFSTGGRIGLPVRAADDGWIWRVTVSPYGYGKAIYVRLEDGRTTVYGHLDHFIAPVERLVRAEQLRQQTYSVDLFLAPGQIPAKRGEPVAFSGRTGIGAPHLHYEVRDAENRPLNMFKDDYTFDDAVPPTLGAIAFVPLDSRARTGEGIEPKILPFAKYGDVWSNRTVPEIWGRVGLAISAWDRTQNGHYLLSIHSTRLEIDGKLVFERRYDRISLLTQYLSGFDRNFYLVSKGEGRYLNLYVAPGNTLDFYGGRPVGSGILACGVGPNLRPETRLMPGRHEMVVTVADFDGNRSVGRMSFIVGRGPQIVEFAPTDSAGMLTLAFAAFDTLDRVGLAADVSTDGGQSWLSLIDAPATEERARVRVTTPRSNGMLVRARARDTAANEVTRIAPIAEFERAPSVRLREKWGRDWLAFEFRSSRPLARLPQVVAEWDEDVHIPIESVEIEPGVYEASVAPEPTWPASYRLRVRTADGVPQVVSQWSGRRTARGEIEAYDDGDARTASYRGVVTFGETFADSGRVRVRGEGFDTTLTVLGRVIGPSGGSYAHRDGRASVEIGRGVLPEPTLVRITDGNLSARGGLEPVGRSYQIQPQNVPLAGEATVVVAVPEGVPMTGLALYQVVGRGATCLEVADPASRTIRARVKALATVGVYRDATPPNVRISAPGGNVRTRTPRIVAWIGDGGSGLDRNDSAMEMRLDGHWVPAAFDPEEARYEYTPDEPLASGSHTVVVTARDRVGNERTVTQRFTVD